jgi:hypothetical protein
MEPDEEYDRILKINNKTAVLLISLLEQFSESNIDEDNFLADIYSKLICAEIFGFNLEALLADAKAAASRLLAEEANGKEDN